MEIKWWPFVPYQYHISRTKIAKSAKKKLLILLLVSELHVSQKQITGFEEADTWAKLLLVASNIILRLPKDNTPPLGTPEIHHSPLRACYRYTYVRTPSTQWILEK